MGTIWNSTRLVFDESIYPPGHAQAVHDHEYANISIVLSGSIEVLIINERNGSAAETGVLMAKLTGAAILVGRPTYGAGIGATLDQPDLIDGGRIAIPNRAAYDPAGTWGIENIGVAPDITVEIDPESWRAGRDPQLEAAVRAALDALRSVKKRPWKRPPYPVHP